MSKTMKHIRLEFKDDTIDKISTPGRYRDAETKGLYLNWNSPTSASWLYRFDSLGKERWKGLGSLSIISLEEAREMANHYRRRLRHPVTKIDPFGRIIKTEVPGENSMEKTIDISNQGEISTRRKSFLLQDDILEVATRGRYYDGSGLILEVQSPTKRYWSYRFNLYGRERQFGLGSARKYSIHDARISAQNIRNLVQVGIDPFEYKEKLNEYRGTPVGINAIIGPDHIKGAEVKIEALPHVRKDVDGLQQLKDCIQLLTRAILDISSHKLTQSGLDRFIRQSELCSIIGLKRTALEEMIMRGEFPKPVFLSSSGRAIAWLESEVRNWQISRVASRDAGEKPSLSPYMEALAHVEAAAELGMIEFPDKDDPNFRDKIFELAEQVRTNMHQEN